MTQQTILAAVDLEHPDSCRAVIAEAAQMAQSKGAGVELCYVLPYGFYSYIDTYIPANVVEDTRARAKADLDALAGDPALAGLEVGTHLMKGGVYQQILRLAGEIAPQAIVINAMIAGHDHGMGPVTSNIARFAQCTVVIVR